MGPTFRANSFPEVTNLICRLPLPTLFYRLEAVHLGDLLRIWVRTGKRFIKLPSHFQGPCGARETPQERRCFTRRRSLSPAEPFPGCAAAKPEKRTLAPTPHSVCEFICVAALSRAVPAKATARPSPCPGAGILTCFPFGNRPTRHKCQRTGLVGDGFRQCLRTD